MNRRGSFALTLAAILSFAVTLGVLSRQDAKYIQNVFPLGASMQTASSSVPESAFVTRVIDGDTIVLSDGRHIRYIGVDTPELARDGNKAQCYAKEAKERNIALVEGKTVSLVSDKGDKDKYGRDLRFVFIGNIFVDKTLIEEGYGRRIYVAPNNGHQSEFQTAEAYAREHALGLWGACE